MDRVMLGQIVSDNGLLCPWCTQRVVSVQQNWRKEVNVLGAPIDDVPDGLDYAFFCGLRLVSGKNPRIVCACPQEQAKELNTLVKERK